MGAHGERLGQHAAPENLHGLFVSSDHAIRPEQLRGHGCAGVECLELIEVHHFVRNAKWVSETAPVGEPPDEGKLAALEIRRHPAARSRLLPLGALSRGLAAPRSEPAPDSSSAGSGPIRWLQLMELHCAPSTASTASKCRTLWSIPRTTGVSGSSTRWCSRRRPRLRIVARWSRGYPMTLLMSVAVMVTAICYSFDASVAESAAAASSALGAAARPSPSRSRRASRGSRRPSRPASVALATFTGLALPRDLVRMSLIPAASTTARTDPPAITPVPRAAGFNMTEAAPKRETVSWGIVDPSFIGTRIRLFFAFSTPLRIESGTSFAFPRPTPTTPWPSPTTTTALKLNRRPPLTTFATRLTRTTFSSSTRPVGSIFGIQSPRGTPLPEFRTRARPRALRRPAPLCAHDTHSSPGRRQ